MTFSTTETPATSRADAAPRLPRPRALLLDFGGVVVTTAKRENGLDEAAALAAAMLERGRVPVPVAEVRRNLQAGLTALTHWKHASSRRLEPRELTHREIVGDFLAAELPVSARALLIAEAAELLDALQTLINDHHLRPGVRRLLQVARSRAIPVGIVSNAHSGRSHRRILAELGIVDAFAVQVYSDEVGMRKPNPRMLELAAAATGVAPADCWYVGDTFDRDVVAAHRAGIGAAIVTRDKHTDHPPFDVALDADAVFDTPEGLADAFEAALATPPSASLAAPAPAARSARRAALLIDHGGVISASHPDPDALLALGEHLSRLLATPGAPLSADEAVRMIRVAKERRAERKGDSLAETQPAEFWVDCFGADLDERSRAVLAAEAVDLMHRYGRAKSRRSLRIGVAEVMQECRDRGMPIVVVSNTLSGRAVRDACAAHGLAEYIGAYVCSDEHGMRKPHRSVVEEALRIADADPSSSWFYGDKPHADAAAAIAAGIGHRVLVRGGAVVDDVLDTAVAAGTATHVVDDANGLLALMQQAKPHLAVS
ncbi:HAD family hydrolase [Demequina subtropica]|uniref:HAD family hydrolase n=1 Tax=Demequina subtropica TaxID=1638989 RepID=UPI00078040E0|nr:HAD-IA family hydrolase [Demequina subtropica]